MYRVFDIVCPNCGKIHYQTTKTYTKKVHAENHMIEMKEPYKSWGWGDRFTGDGHGYGSMVCPECEHQLAPDGYLKATIQKETE